MGETKMVSKPLSSLNSCINLIILVLIYRFCKIYTVGMGNTLRNGDNGPGSSQQIAGHGGRRKRSLEKDSQSEEEVEELAPRRKKIVATSTYIYETLFKKGINSDVTITALG